MRDHLIQLKCRTLFVAAIALCWTSALEAARCPAFSERMQLKPDPDLLQWPVAQQIGSQNLLYGRQTITQARRCEEAGELERAANYYFEAEGLLARALTPEYRKQLLDKSSELRARARPRITPRNESSSGRGSPVSSDWKTSYDSFVRDLQRLLATNWQAWRSTLAVFAGQRVTWEGDYKGMKPDLTKQTMYIDMSIPERMIRLGDRDVKLYVGRYTGKDHFTAGFSALVRASSAHFNDHIHFSGVVREVVVGTADDHMTVVCVIVDTAEFIN
jgi:hypothetical protein